MNHSYRVPNTTPVANKTIDDPNHHNPAGIQLTDYMPCQVDMQSVRTMSLSLAPDTDYTEDIPTFNNYNYNHLF